MSIPPKAFRARRNPEIPKGESIWDFAPATWDLDCNGCITDCQSEFEGECGFFYPSTPQTTIRFACRCVPEMRIGKKCKSTAGEYGMCSEMSEICPFWLVKTQYRKPRNWKGLLICDKGPGGHFYTFLRRWKS